ncbi:MAG: shikimate dehydrogenase [Lentisphaeria bacterium]|nr:shikimate dehydrogenase [Lentisphaeria bacterium]
MNPDTALHFAVIGDPIAHSKSPLMHNAAFRALGMNADYTAVHVTKDALPGFLERARTELNGFNVTVPHKNAVIPFLDGVTDRAKLAGSVNTVSVREGKLYGDTTDPTGLERALLEVFGMPLNGAKVCILGSGGVVRALVYHLADAGCARLRILNRTADKAAKLIDEVRAHAPGLDCGSAALDDLTGVREALDGSGVVLQCTSLGLHEGDGSPIDPDLIPAHVCVFDTIYRETAILAGCRARGMKVSGGLPMLVHQGAESFRIWTGRDAPVEVMRHAAE